MRRSGIRARECIGTQPGRARVLALAAAVAMLSVAGGAVVVHRSGDDPEGRRRHGHYAGAIDTGAATPNPSTAPAVDPSTGAAPDASPDLAAPAGAAVPGDGAPVPAAGSSTTAAAPSGPAGEAQSAVTSGGAPAKTPGSRQAPTTRPVAPSTSTAGAAAAAPGWHPLPAAPIAGRADHTAVWTGREMVLWGGTGYDDPDPYIDGAAYDPAARTWRKLPGAPLSPRHSARAYWTGREMIVFGGTSTEGDDLADGAAWDPVSNTWRGLPASPLGPRNGAVVAWAGDRLVVWGGATVLPDDAAPEAASEMPNDGSAYVPATNSWVALAPAPIPGRSGAESAWTGSRLVISGGAREGEDYDRSDGAALDPVSGAWSPIAARPARPEPGSCGGIGCDGVWTGTAALFPASGLRYEPAGDGWSVVAPAPETDGPAPGEPAVWTGRRLLVWGIATEGDGSGENVPTDEEIGEASRNAGAMYDPVGDEWDLFPAGPLSGRYLHTMVWSGEEMLVWGGSAEDGSLADGAAYRPE